MVCCKQKNKTINKNNNSVQTGSVIAAEEETADTA